MLAADVAFARALEHWQAESLQEAHAACLEAIGHDEGHVGAAVLAAEILLRVGEPEPAEGGEPVGSTLVCLRRAELAR